LGVNVILGALFGAIGLFNLALAFWRRANDPALGFNLIVGIAGVVSGSAIGAIIVS
jgi:hypothetical protein